MRIKKSNTKDQLAKRLREVRIDNRLTQKEMGKIINMTAGSVGALENGLYTPNFDVLRTLKKKLNVSYDFLIDGEINMDASKIIKENIELKEEVERLKKMVDKLLK
ncbi:MAG: helix-turn-helix protein [Bacteroidota bacterium]|jgi:transcriptional regulator with XRE-family HTH domain